MEMTSEDGLVKCPDLLEFSFFRGSVICVVSFQSNDKNRTKQNPLPCDGVVFPIPILTGKFNETPPSY